MLNPVKRFSSNRTPLIWKYPAPFDNTCSLFVDEDTVVVVWKDNHIYKKIMGHGISQLTDCPEDARLYFIYVKSYELTFGVKRDNKDVLYERIVIQICDPEAFFYSIIENKSIVTGATADIHCRQTVREGISVCQDEVSIEKVNCVLKERKAGFRIVDWRCVNEDENKSIRCE